MNISIGGIYELNKDWNPYKNPLFDNRPVIVLKKEGNYVYVVLMGALHNFSQKDKHLMIEYKLSGKKYISAVACDVIHKISVEHIKNNIGYIEENVLNHIYAKAGWLIAEEKVEQTVEQTEMPSNKDVELVCEGIEITDEDKFMRLLSRTSEDISAVRGYVEGANKKINIWKERIVSFVLGIVASVIASFIWEVRLDIGNAIIEFVNKVITIFSIT